MSDREKIFTAIREALAPLKTRTEKPEWETEMVISNPPGKFDSLKDHFADRLAFASGYFYDSVPALVEYLKKEGITLGYCDPKLLYLFDGIEGLEIDTEYDVAKLNDYGFGVTRASCAVAESGTIVLTDKDTSCRLGALTPWTHIAVIAEDDIVPHFPAAIERFGDDPSVIFATGPSKTADVEGILIKGVHGPGIQIGLVI